MVGIRYMRNYASEHFDLQDRLLHPMESGKQCGTDGLTDPI